MSTSTIKAPLPFTNPNILDNPYFLSPINQRGASSYSGSKYGIDRWISTASSLTVNVVSSGLQLVTSAANSGNLEQRFESGRYRGLLLTATVLFSDGTVKTGTVTTPTANAETVYFDESFPKLRFNTLSSYDRFQIETKTSTTVTIVAVKLEVGANQTLVFYDGAGWQLREIPNISDQIVRCQRYYYRLNLASWQLMVMGICSAVRNIAFTMPFPRMHAAPTMSSPNTVGMWSSGGTWVTVQSFTVKYTPNSPSISFDVYPSANATVGVVYAPVIEAGGYVEFNADL